MSTAKNILLLNFGGPENLDQVENFLYQLFADREAIQMPLPAFGQKILARIIARFRCKSSQAKYQHIGGRSPLPEITANLARKMSAMEPLFQIELAMRYGEPSIKTVLEKMFREKRPPDYIIPLYPHYSYATTFTIEAEVQKNMHRIRQEKADYTLQSPIFLRCWYEHPAYIALIADYIKEIKQDLSSCQDDILYLFCAHGIPLSYIKKGDPYPEQIRKQVSLIIEKSDLKEHCEIAWQSRTGPNKWLNPDCENVVLTYAEKGFKHLVTIPLSFVCDNLETGWDLDKELQKIALDSGFKTCRRMSMPNDSDAFAAFLLLLCRG
jgi:ferrochelatase